MSIESGDFGERNTVLWTRSNKKWQEGVIGTILKPASKPDRMLVQVDNEKLHKIFEMSTTKYMFIFIKGFLSLL